MSADILAIFPASCTRDARFDDHKAAVTALCSCEPQWFYYAADQRAALANLLSDGRFGTVVLGFSGLSAAAPPVEMVRSLALKARIVLYHPDVSCFEDAGAPVCGELGQWRSLGIKIMAALCRQADIAVVKDEREAALVHAQAPGLPVQSGIAPLDGLARERRAARKVSIVMLTFNQLDQTRQCVESLLKHTVGDYELIFVDNGSTDGTPDYLESLRAKSDSITVIVNSKNLGFAKANNQGMRVAAGDYLLLLNNDVILTEGWLDRMLACAESDPETGVVGPCTNHAVGQQVTEMDIEQDDREIQRFAALQVLKNAGIWFETHRIIGFCMLIKREVVERAGMLDEAFGPGGFEDYDYCLRVHQAGYKIQIASDVFVYHIGGQGYVRNNLDYDKLRERNVEIFIEKWCRRALEAFERLPDGA